MSKRPKNFDAMNGDHINGPDYKSDKKRSSMPVMATVFVILALSASLIIRQAGVSRMCNDFAELESEIKRYTSMNEALENQIELLRSDEYVEKMARDKLGLVKPGEIRYMMVTQATN